MSSNKKYFWLRLKEDFFKNLAMKKLRKIAGGDTYTIIYLKLMLLSLKDEGSLYYQGVEEDISDELALLLDEDPDNVRVTLDFLERVRLIERVSESEIRMSAVPTLIGSETRSAELMRLKREKEKNDITQKSEIRGNIVTPTLPTVTSELPSVTPELQSVKNCYTEIEIEIDKDINIYKGANKDKNKDPESDCAEQAQHLQPLEEKLIDLYHENCPSLPKVIRVTDNRKRKIKKMFRKYSLSDFKRAFEIAEKSAFLRGECNSPGHESFKADFDFFLDERKLISTLEGKYSGSGSGGGSGGGRHHMMESDTDYGALESMLEEEQLQKAQGIECPDDS